MSYPSQADKPNTEVQPGIVYVVDDDPASREAVAELVQEMGVQSKTFGSAEEFLEKYDGRRPACLVTDVRMLRMSGLELQEELEERGTGLATIVLTAYADTPVTVRAIKNGAVTLLEKPCRDLELWDAIREGLSQDSATWAADCQQRERAEQLASLTDAERAVLDLILDGEPNKAVASKLEISVRTVEVRRQNIYSKMHADSIAQLVRHVLEARKQT